MINQNSANIEFVDWENLKRDSYNRYASKTASFIRGLIPEVAIQLPILEVFEILQSRFSQNSLVKALEYTNTIPSPVRTSKDGSWLRHSRIVGINVRTIGNFFNIVKYLLTIGDNIDSVHILPIWEPGVVSSLYGKTSWNINTEFFSHELQAVAPALDSVEKQLKIVVNLIHLMGKTVGMDVIPHTDRFSELVFLHPQLFEWVYREGDKIIDIDSRNSLKVQEMIWEYLQIEGPTSKELELGSKEDFFGSSTEQVSRRNTILFGSKEDKNTRLHRRLGLIQACIKNGLETMPVTMAPPYRGLTLEKKNYILDNLGHKWYNYVFKKPEAYSRVFGPLTRYKFYESDKEQNWLFDNPNVETWDYVANQYLECQNAYNFDYMRGDMAHVQPRKEGVPEEIGQFYDPLKYIKNHIQANGYPYFGFFAETFLQTVNTMAYGDECDHLEAIEADTTLADLQSTVVGGKDFNEYLRRYVNIASARKVTPSFTIMTADKDDPRFDVFFEQGNLLRYFMGTFFDVLPSYVSLGFECRNDHKKRGENEEYSKLYVFQIRDSIEKDKFTRGPYIWGKNYSFFEEIEKLKILFDEIFTPVKNQETILISLTDNHCVWRKGNLLFASKIHSQTSFDYPFPAESNLIYSSESFEAAHECRIYKLD
ncbi:MAG: hypothetical protein ACRCVT_03385 [Leadbetterella sp.]